MSGSVRNSTISEFLRRQAPGTLNEIEQYYLLGDQNNNKDRDLKACFQVFPIIHRLLSDKAILARVTREVLEDFEAENCVYLELRTVRHLDTLQELTRSSFEWNKFSKRPRGISWTKTRM